MRHMLHLLVIALITLAAPSGLAEGPQHDYRLIVLGDSLSAGFGLADDAALPAALERELHARGVTHVRLINASVSGDTSAAGLARFDFSIGPDADGVLIALGANDALQGLPPEGLRANLTAMIERARARDLDVVLAGMLAPVNLGEDYRQSFDAVFAELAAEQDVPLYPFLLAPIAFHPEYLQRDGMHPTPDGVELMAAPLADFLVRTLFAQPAAEPAP